MAWGEQSGLPMRKNLVALCPRPRKVGFEHRKYRSLESACRSITEADGRQRRFGMRPPTLNHARESIRSRNDHRAKS